MINLRSAAGNASIAAGCLIVLGIAAILLSRSQPPEATPVEKSARCDGASGRQDFWDSRLVP